MKRTFFLTLLLLPFCIQIGSAQQRERLNEGWEFVKHDLGGVWEAVRPNRPGTPETLPLWEQVALPHSFNDTDAVAPDVNYYQGPGWYRTTLTLDNPYENGRTLLHFEGAGQKTEVYIHTRKVAEHVGGYDEWVVDITDAVAAYGSNEIPLVIRCDNSRDLELIPSDLSDFNVYGGIYRYLNLAYVPSLSVDKAFATVTTDSAGEEGLIQLTTRLHNPLDIQAADIVVELLDPAGNSVAKQEKSFANFDAHIALEDIKIAQPLLWSTEQPQLYNLQITVNSGTDSYLHTERIGFRHFEFVAQGPFMLNGERLLLRGTHRHEDHAEVGPAMTEEMIWREMQMMKEMGVNFIRLGHYQQSRIVLEACDSLGILVWEEIPWCRGGLGGEVYKDQARRMLTNMIEQHYNHPSVIIWGLGNENDWPGDFEEFDQQKIREFMSELNALSHQLDPLRKTAIRRCDFCKDIVDVYSPSIWAGWYRGVYTDYKEASATEFDKVDHFLHVEWGGDSHAGRHAEDPYLDLSDVASTIRADERAGDASLSGGQARASKDGDWSESYIVDMIDWHLKEQETMPWLTGTAYWPFKDFSTPIRPENPVPYMNQKGVVERNFNKKESYYVFQSYWTIEPMAHIYGHSWPVRWGAEGEKKMVKVFSNCEEAELFVNGVSQGVRQRDSQDFPAAGLRWMVEYAPGDNHIEVVARQGETTVRDTITQRYQSEAWGVPAQIQVEAVESAGDIITIQALFLDDKGVPCLDSRDYFYFSMLGDGHLLANLGTSDGASTVQAYNGRAVIRLKRTGDKAIVAVKADGLETAMLDVGSE